MKLGDEQFAEASAVGAGRPARARRHRASSPASPTSSPATPPTTSSPRSTRSACATARTSQIDGYEFAPTFSIWTTIEECLNPPRDLGARPRLVHDGRRSPSPRCSTSRPGIGPVECVNVEHEEVVLDPALGRLPARARSSTGSATSSSTCSRRCTSSGSTAPSRSTCAARPVAPRDVVAAALPNPAELGDRMHGLTCAGHARHRDRQGRRAARDLPATTSSTTRRRWRATAARPSSGRRR